MNRVFLGCALAVTLGACSGARSGLDAAAAIGDLAAADREWNDFQNAKAQAARAAFDGSIEMHSRFMKATPPKGMTAKVANVWCDRNTELLKAIDDRLGPVYHSTYYEKIMLVEAQNGEAWEKLSRELNAVHAAAAPGDDKDTLTANLNQTLLNAVTYYGRVANDYTTDHPEVAKRQPELIATAKKRGAALAEMRARIAP